MREEDVSGLATFVAVAHKRSFTAAAATLGVTPCAVSQTVKQLEARLGARLLQRTTRRVSLTEAGELLLDRIEPALLDAAVALESVATLSGRVAGTLRIGAPQIASTMLLEPLLTGFLACHPDLRIELVVNDALTDIVEAGCDAGIRLAESLEKDVLAVPLGNELSLAVVGAPSYFQSRQPPRHPRDLREHDCIRFRQMPSGTLYDWEFDEDGKSFAVAVDGRLIVNDSALLVRAAVDGLGLAQVFAESVNAELASGRLVRVLAKYCAPFRGFHLYYSSRVQQPMKLKALVEYLRARKRALPARHVRSRTPRMSPRSP